MPALLEDPHALADEDFEHQRDEHGVTDRTFVEHVSVVDIVSGYHRLTIALDLASDHDYPEAWAQEAAAPMTASGAGDD